MIPVTCSRIRLGGTVSGSTISGGTSIQSDAIFVTTLAGLMGHPGRRGGNVTVPFLDGQLRRTVKRSLPRQLSLTVEVMDRNASGLIPTTRGQVWEANMDTLNSLLDGRGESVIVERDMADGSTRFIEAEILQPFTYSDGMRTSSHVSYIGVIPLEAHHPYWQSEAQSSKAIAATFTPSGNAKLFNHVISYATAGNHIHSESGASVIVSAGSFPVLVDFGKRQVTVSGVDASNRVTLNKSYWMDFPSGTSATFTATATGTMTYRSQYL